MMLLRNALEFHCCILSFRRFQCFKIVMIVGVFICIFFGTIISKITVLLAAVNMRTNTPLYCVQYNYTYINGSDIHAKCITLPNNYTVTNQDSCLMPENGEADSIERIGQSYSVCNAVAIRWIWGLTLILLTPEIFVFLRNLSTMCFKREKTPSRTIFLVVSVYF